MSAVAEMLFTHRSMNRTINIMIIAKKSQKYWIWIALAAIVLVGGFLRTLSLGERPFVADEFLDINATYGYHQTGSWQAWDFNQEQPSIRDNPASDRRAWMYRVQVASLFSYLPPVEWVARSISVLWSILTIVIIYGVTYSWTKSARIGLIASALFAVSIPAIEIGRTLRMYSMFAPIFLLLSWSVSQFFGRSFAGYRITQSRWMSLVNFDFKYLVVSVLLSLLAAHLHLLTLNLAFVLLSFVCVMWAYGVRYKEGMTIFRYGVYSAVAVACLVIGGTVITMFADMPHLLKFNDNTGYIEHILRHFWHPVLGAMLILWGIIVSFTRRDDQTVSRIWVSVTALTIVTCATFLWNRNVGAQYIYFVQPFILILTAIGLDHLYEEFQKAFSAKRLQRGFWIVAIILLPHYGYFFLENNTYNLTAASETPDYRKVFDYVKDHGRAGEPLVTRNFRNYYYGGIGFDVTDFGSERSQEKLDAEGKFAKITSDVLRDIQKENPTGWFVYTDNDENFISKDARVYAQENFQRITDSPLLRGKIFVYRWGKDHVK